MKPELVNFRLPTADNIRLPLTVAEMFGVTLDDVRFDVDFAVANRLCNSRNDVCRRDVDCYRRVVVRRSSRW